RDRLLPLDTERIGSLAVVGTARDDAQWVMAGSPCVRVSPERRVTPLEGITPRAGAGLRGAFAQGSPGEAGLPPRGRPRSSPRRAGRRPACSGSSGTAGRPTAHRP